MFKKYNIRILNVNNNNNNLNIPWIRRGRRDFPVKKGTNISFVSNGDGSIYGMLNQSNNVGTISNKDVKLYVILFFLWLGIGDLIIIGSANPNIINIIIFLYLIFLILIKKKII